MLSKIQIQLVEDSGIDIKTDTELEQAYDNSLSELYGQVDICGMSFDSARALQELDPTAYRCGFNDWTDANDWNELDCDGTTIRYYNSNDIDIEAVIS